MRAVILAGAFASCIAAFPQDSTTCFTSDEARAVDQYIQDCQTKERNYAAAITERDKQIANVKSYAAHCDSLYASADLRAAMLSEAHDTDRKENADLSLKVEKRGSTIKALVLLSALLTLLVIVK